MVNPMINGLNPAAISGRQAVKAKSASGGSFQETLRAKIAESRPGAHAPAEGLKISTHAENRMASRGINLTPEKKLALEKGVDMAAEKGGKDALLVMGDVNFIVNVPSRTLVTAVDPDQNNGNVFTNIDSAVVIPG